MFNISPGTFALHAYELRDCSGDHISTNDGSCVARTAVYLTLTHGLASWAKIVTSEEIVTLSPMEINHGQFPSIPDHEYIY